jgi:hypothetical protein
MGMVLPGPAGICSYFLFEFTGGASAVMDMIFSPLRMMSPKTLLISFSGSPWISKFTLFLWFDPSEFFSLANDQIEMLIEGQKSTHYHSVVGDGNPYSMVDPLNKFRLLRRHLKSLLNIYNNQFYRFQTFRLLSAI